MSPARASNMEKLESRLAQVISREEAKLEQFEDYSKQYDELMGVLEDLPTKLSHDIKVPFTKMAFFDGQIIHTNEVVMHLGAEWFAERTVASALKTVKQRASHVENNVAEQRKTVENVRKEREYIQDPSLVNREKDVETMGDRGDEKKNDTEQKKKKGVENLDFNKKLSSISERLDTLDMSDTVDGSDTRGNAGAPMIIESGSAKSESAAGSNAPDSKAPDTSASAENEDENKTQKKKKSNPFAANLQKKFNSKGGLGMKKGKDEGKDAKISVDDNGFSEITETEGAGVDAWMAELREKQEKEVEERKREKERTEKEEEVKNAENGDVRGFLGTGFNWGELDKLEALEEEMAKERDEFEDEAEEEDQKDETNPAATETTTKSTTAKPEPKNPLRETIESLMDMDKFGKKPTGSSASSSSEPSVKTNESAVNPIRKLGEPSSRKIGKVFESKLIVDKYAEENKTESKNHALEALLGNTATTNSSATTMNGMNPLLASTDLHKKPRKVDKSSLAGALDQQAEKYAGEARDLEIPITQASLSGEPTKLLGDDACSGAAGSLQGGKAIGANGSFDGVKHLPRQFLLGPTGEQVKEEMRKFIKANPLPEEIEEMEGKKEKEQKKETKSASPSSSGATPNGPRKFTPKLPAQPKSKLNFGKLGANPAMPDIPKKQLVQPSSVGNNAMSSGEKKDEGKNAAREESPKKSKKLNTAAVRLPFSPKASNKKTSDASKSSSSRVRLLVSDSSGNSESDSDNDGGFLFKPTSTKRLTPLIQELSDSGPLIQEVNPVNPLIEEVNSNPLIQEGAEKERTSSSSSAESTDDAKLISWRQPELESATPNESTTADSPTLKRTTSATGTSGTGPAVRRPSLKRRSTILEREKLKQDLAKPGKVGWGCFDKADKDNDETDGEKDSEEGKKRTQSGNDNVSETGSDKRVSFSDCTSFNEKSDDESLMENNSSYQTFKRALAWSSARAKFQGSKRESLGSLPVGTAGLGMGAAGLGAGAASEFGKGGVPDDWLASGECGALGIKGEPTSRDSGNSDDEEDKKDWAAFQRDFNSFGGSGPDENDAACFESRLGGGALRGSRLGSSSSSGPSRALSSVGSGETSGPSAVGNEGGGKKQSLFKKRRVAAKHGP